MLGWIFAIISSLFFSLYVVPRKLSKLTPVIFSFFMSIGFAVSSLLVYLSQPLLKFHETPSLVLWWSVLAGVIWATAFVSFIMSIDAIGLSRSNQWKNLQGPVGVFLSLLILGEYAKTNPFFAMLAAIAIFLSALFFTTASGKGKGVHVRGIILASISAVGFGSVAVIQKYVTAHVGVYSQQVVWSLSIMGSLFLYILLTQQLKKIKVLKKEFLLGLSAGVLYLGASFFQLFSFQQLSVSIAFTIIQMNALWTVLIGIFVFKEIDFGKYYKRVSLGLLFTLVGIFFLLFARK